MATRRFRGVEIGSRVPAVDLRNVDDIYVLSGRNYSFDSLGPKTDFGDRFLLHQQFTTAVDMHSNRVADRCFIHTPYALYEYVSDLQVLNPLFYFIGSAGNFNKYRWRAAFLGNKIYFAHQTLGWLYIDLSTEELALTAIQIDETTHPGLPASPIAITETNGRLIILTSTTVYWSAAGDGLSLTPAPGGAGFQLIAARIGGTPIALTRFSGGFMISTTGGTLLAEYIGGTNVFRFTTINVANRPQNNFCFVQMNNDDSLMLTDQGLFTSRRGQALEPFRPEFNEFLRDHLGHSPRAVGRLEYDEYRDRIYVMLRTHHSEYTRTFVLTPTLEKWGEFSERCYAIMAMTPTLFGWVGLDRRARYWLEAPSREVQPTDGLTNYRFSRLNKRQVWLNSEVSTSGICQHDSHSANLLEGFYIPETDVPIRHSLAGLNAEIQVGFIRPALIESGADGIIEIQQVAVGSYPQALPSFLIPGNAQYDYFKDIYEPLYVETLDLNELSGEEDWNLGDSSESWHGHASLLNPYAYNFTIHPSMDGRELEAVTPELALFRTEVSFYSTLTAGNLHRLKFTADEIGQAVHLRYLEFTLNRGGRL